MDFGIDGFAIIFSQGRDLVKQKWTVKSLNNVLGLIGGYTALLWMVITFPSIDGRAGALYYCRAAGACGYSYLSYLSIITGLK